MVNSIAPFYRCRKINIKEVKQFLQVHTVVDLIHLSSTMSNTLFSFLFSQKFTNQIMFVACHQPRMSHLEKEGDSVLGGGCQ